MQRLNIILFGATGYTGKATIPALHKLTKQSKTNLTWGIAGRSRDKLEKVLIDASKQLGTDLSHIPIIIADATNENSLNEMAAKALVIINVCGPFRFYGEPIVKACIANGTHHLDISGEPQFIETIELKYAEAAVKNKCYIISSCGFDSIPADLGVVFMQQNFPGKLDSTEAHLQISSESAASQKGPVFNYATWESAVNGMHDYQTLKMIRRKLNEKRAKIPPKRVSDKKKSIFKNSITGQWSLPFPGADASVVKRSQQYFYEHEDKAPINFDMYFCVDSVSSIIGSLFIFMTLSTLSRSETGKKLLLKHPKLFSFGAFTRGTPIEEERKTTRASIFMKGTGRFETSSDKGADASEDYIIGQVSALDPAYGNTGTIVTLAAITLLEESDKLPNSGNGGVFTPGAAFSKTTLIERLNRNGINFKILSNI